VDVRPPAVVRDDLRYRSGPREQGVQHLDGGRVVARLARPDDRVQPGSVGAQPGDVPVGGWPAAERVPVPERLHVRHAAKLVPGRGAAGVDQLGARGERLDEVSTKTALTPVRTVS
jgi:hypothetical protein